MKKLTTVFLFLMLVPVLFAQESAPSSRDLNYSFGLLMAQSLVTTGLDIDVVAVTEGLTDALTKGRTPRFDIDQAKQYVTLALQAAQAKADAAQVEVEQSYLKTHGQEKGVLTTASGLQWEVLKAGTGPKPNVNDVVKVDYVGSLANGTKFDSSIDRGEPAVFPLNQVIPGWTEGLQLMAVGGKYRLTVPSNLAYGAQGAGEVIPPYATLVFEVDLLSIEPPEAELPTK